jgi:biopolymer transport protein ExbB
MQNAKESSTSSLKSLFTVGAMVAALIVGFLVFYLVLGNPSHFQDNDPTKLPKNGDLYGTIYKGGFIVPILMALLIIVITFSIERLLTIMRSSGTGNPDSFLKRVKVLLEQKKIDEAIAQCDKQKGSIGNVVKTGLLKYKQVENNPEMDKDQKLAAIEKDIEESTSLELPMLEKNLVILATIASIATLMGLLGTVLGMIRAFAALANAGAPDAVQLSTGISEALINTAFGIGTSALAIILYNTFTNTIDGITYRIDEAGFSISQTFASHSTPHSVSSQMRSNDVTSGNRPTPQLS